MSTAYQPSGFQSIIPYLTVKGAEQLVTFLVVAFEAEERQRALRDDGTIANIAMRIGDSMLEISEASATYGANISAIHLYVVDTNAAYARALQGGATSLFSPHDAAYGERTAGVVDPTGNSWYIATYQGEQAEDNQ